MPEHPPAPQIQSADEEPGAGTVGGVGQSAVIDIDVVHLNDDLSILG